MEPPASDAQADSVTPSATITTTLLAVRSASKAPLSTVPSGAVTSIGAAAREAMVVTPPE